MLVRRRMGALHIDRCLMIYDLRTMRALPPLHVNVEPMLLRCVPITNRIAVVSQVTPARSSVTLKLATNVISIWYLLYLLVP